MNGCFLIFSNNNKRGEEDDMEKGVAGERSGLRMTCIRGWLVSVACTIVVTHTRPNTAQNHSIHPACCRQWNECGIWDRGAPN